MAVRPMFRVIFIILLFVKSHHCTTTEDGSNQYTDFFQQYGDNAEDGFQHVSDVTSGTKLDSTSDETSEMEGPEKFSIAAPLTETTRNELISDAIGTAGTPPFPTTLSSTGTLPPTTTPTPLPGSPTPTPAVSTPPTNLPTTTTTITTPVTRPPTTVTTTTTTTTTSTTNLPDPPINCPETRTNYYTIPKSEPGSWAIPIDIICLYEDYTPVRFHCLNNGTWNDIEISCSNVNITETTEILHNLLLSNETSAIVISNLSSIVKQNLRQLKIIDIHYVAMILRKTCRDVNVNVNSSQFFETIGNIITIEKNVLNSSQEILNSTDIVLDSLSIATSKVPAFSVPHLFMDVINTSSEIFGAMIISNENRTFSTFEVQPLYKYNESALIPTTFEVALVIPSEDEYHVSVFPNDYLFNEKDIKTPGSWIISIPEAFNSTIEIYFREFRNTFNQTCHYWKYGPENGISLSGKWEFDSMATEFKDGYYKCEFNRAGYLGMFVSAIEPPVIMCPETKFQDHVIPETSAGSWVTPSDTICLHLDYTPVRIQCLSNGTFNLTEDLSCSSVSISNTTQSLYNILITSPITALEDVSSVIGDVKTNLEVIDIHYIAQILNKASTETDVASNSLEFIKTVNHTMGVQKNVLKSSQELLNSTDTILYSLDQLLKNSGDVNFTVPKLLVLTITPNDNIYGAMITSQDKDTFNSFDVTYLHDDYEDILINSNFEAAFIVPQNFDHYYITIFYNDNLFNQKTNSGVVGSWIVSILLPDGTTISDSTLRIYFKEFQTTFDQKCQHWKYGIDTENQVAIAGNWNFDSPALKFKDGYYMCEVNHTTHFGMLVSDSAPESVVLDLITIFGSVLSIVGIMIIFLTALVFKQWRNKVNSKIILNISLCLLLVIILFIVCDKIDKGPVCITFGMLLHYFVLAQFCWALTISYSSYRKFHVVYSDHIEHIVLKFCAFSWLTPLIVIIITASVNVHTYDKELESSEICYPKGLHLKLGVILPMSIILAINAIIYIFIAKNLLATTLDLRKHETKKSFSIQKSLVLLFFMLGITWIFGFLVAFTDNIIFLYLFCTTATCHGFVIFIFYVLDSTEIMQLWQETFRRIFNKKSEPKSKQDQSTTTEPTTDASVTLSK